MQIEIFVLCDRSQIKKSPKGEMAWIIISPFDSIEVSEFPARVNFTIVTAIRFLPYEYGDHKISISMIDADGKQLIDRETNRKIGYFRSFKVPDMGKSHSQYETWCSGEPGEPVGMNGSLIENPGDYFFDLMIDGNAIARLPVHISLGNFGK
jgi:hypothetical protein